MNYPRLHKLTKRFLYLTKVSRTPEDKFKYYIENNYWIVIDRTFEENGQYDYHFHFFKTKPIKKYFVDSIGGWKWVEDAKNEWKWDNQKFYFY